MQVRLVQFMGKDNIPFHTVIFPSSLIGTEEPWTLLHHVSTTECDRGSVRTSDDHALTLPMHARDAMQVPELRRRQILQEPQRGRVWRRRQGNGHRARGALPPLRGQHACAVLLAADGHCACLRRCGGTTCW